jgi:cellulose synthase/poly-beta-1,6-N-acetylglucosamine synthase-like glycosyltransferase
MSLVLGLSLLAVPVLIGGYAFLAYPMLLRIAGDPGARLRTPADVDEWPSLTITLPVYNEEANVGGALERLLERDYPVDRRHVLVISDASTDRTDEIVRSFANHGVTLLRLPVRRGKTVGLRLTFSRRRSLC